MPGSRKTADKKRALIKKLHGQGLTDNELGEACGCTGQHAGRLRRELGLPRHPDRPGHPVNERLRSEVRRLHAKGHPDWKIAKLIKDPDWDYDERYVSNIRRELGLDPNKAKRRYNRQRYRELTGMRWPGEAGIIRRRIECWERGWPEAGHNIPVADILDALALGGRVTADEVIERVKMIREQAESLGRCKPKSMTIARTTVVETLRKLRLKGMVTKHQGGSRGGKTGKGKGGSLGSLPCTFELDMAELERKRKAAAKKQRQRLRARGEDPYE